MTSSSSVLGGLIDACIDEHRMLDHERWRVDAYRNAVLARLAAERALAIARLTELGSAVGTSARGGSWPALQRALGRATRAFMEGSDDGDPIAACCRSCRRTEERFDRALELQWPEAIRRVLAEQREVARDANVVLNALQY
jgi:hypothetical protein